MPALFCARLLTKNRITCIIQLRTVLLERHGFQNKKVCGNAMISFEGFTKEDGSPIYLQILRYIKRGVVAGSIRDGDELPSRRVLSALLGVNPNTVQKAYRLLEDEELIQSRSGAKSFMLIDDEKTKLIRAELLEGDVLSVVSSMQQMGLTKDAALALIEKYWQ